MTTPWRHPAVSVSTVPPPIEVPELVDRVIAGELPIGSFITHRMRGVEKTLDAVEALHGGDCLRAVVTY